MKPGAIEQIGEDLRSNFLNVLHVDIVFDSDEVLALLDILVVVWLVLRKAGVLRKSSYLELEVLHVVGEVMASHPCALTSLQAVEAVLFASLVSSLVEHPDK